MSKYQNEHGDIVLLDRETLYKYTADCLNIPETSIDPKEYSFSPRDHESVYFSYGEHSLRIVDKRVLGTVQRITGKACPLYTDLLFKKDIRTVAFLIGLIIAFLFIFFYLIFIA